MYDSKFTDKIYLLHKDGRRWEFKDIYDAVETLKDWGLYDGHHRDSKYIDDHYRAIGHYDHDHEEYVIDGHIEYILRSDFGEIITIADLNTARDIVRNDRFDAYLDNKHSIATKNYRNGPVPNIRCLRGGGYSYYRRIHTFAEHRDNEGLLRDEDAQEYRVIPRPKRVSMNLPNSWDDIGRSDYRNKNWKRHRKTQWKEKK